MMYIRLLLIFFCLVVACKSAEPDNKHALNVKSQLSNREKDEQKLSNLYREIIKISTSVPCIDAKGWMFTAYGSKACGGPQGYIAFSNKIDTIGFLQKVKRHREVEHEYNLKWGIVSTCETPRVPKGVVCKNGLPVFTYEVIHYD